MSQIETVECDDIRIFRLKNSDVQIDVSNFGAMIMSIRTPDRDGQLADIVLGYDHVKDYINAVDKPYFGAVVGRYGNRIANAKFSIDGQEYTLAANNGDNHLHGGKIGFDKVVWDAEPVSGDNWVGLELKYLAKDGEEGYPGNLSVAVLYKLTDANELVCEYSATTDKATPVNLTQHSYFNLKGEGNGDILKHELQINASKFTPVDVGLIPTGELVDVEETPFDFQKSKPIGRDINVEHPQLKTGLGYDHNWVIDKTGELSIAAKVYEPETGRTLEVSTTEPGLQFYCGNFLDGRLTGKSGEKYVHRGGFCLETQHFPDSPNQPGFPSTILRPGQTYKSTTVFRFGSR